jgi:hypothetical protein
MMLALGWYVRVITGVVDDDGYESVVYIAGFPELREAEAAVRKAHSGPTIGFDVIGRVLAGMGPQITPGEVQFLEGAK